MAGGRPSDLLQNLDTLVNAGTVAGLSDLALLTRFVARRGEAAEVAFGAIVARHGPMVLGVCRQVLRDPNDVNDAFQATFLVLVRKAGTVRVSDSLAPWLYSVAYRVAVRARSIASRRQGRETGGVDAVAAPSTDDPGIDDRFPVLHEELNRLPEKYRAPVVLCHLEGKTHAEAARHLRCPVGTVSGRLSRARDLLRSRLTRRGVTAGSVALTLEPRPATAVSPALLGSTVQAASRVAAGGTVSASVWKLTQGVLIAMLLNKLKWGLVVVSAAGVLALGAGVAISQTPDPAPKTPAPPPSVPTKPRAEQPSNDRKTAAAPEPGRDRPAEIQVKTNPVIRQIRAIGTRSIIVSMSPDQNKLSALSLSTGGNWRTYTAPPGASLAYGNWNGNDHLIALSMSGSALKKELAVFDGNRGEWMTQPLEQPTKEPIGPPNNTGHPFLGVVATYVVGNNIYCYSPLSQSWGALKLPNHETPVVEGREKAILVQQGKLLYVFNAQTGKWSSGIEAEAPMEEPPLGTQ